MNTKTKILGAALLLMGVGSACTQRQTAVNGHECVDLGLSVKWAACNVGASSPEDYGDYFAWGETVPKEEYTWDNCAMLGEKVDDLAGNPRYDAARINWGDTWRLPTRSETEELIEKCEWTWTTQDNQKGYKVTGPNGNSIFLPAAGFRSGSLLEHEGHHGYYWSASNSSGDTDYADNFNFDSGEFVGDCSSRFIGFSIRPVTE